MNTPTVLISVRLGNPHVARAGNGKTSKTASCTSDLVDTPQGQRAALTAAAKYFACDEDAVDIRCISAGDQCAKRPAIFQAEKGDAS